MTGNAVALDQRRIFCASGMLCKLYKNILNSTLKKTQNLTSSS